MHKTVQTPNLPKNLGTKTIMRNSSNQFLEMEAILLEYFYRQSVNEQLNSSMVQHLNLCKFFSANGVLNSSNVSEILLFTIYFLLFL